MVGSGGREMVGSGGREMVGNGGQWWAGSGRHPAVTSTGQHSRLQPGTSAQHSKIVKR